jgi:hypothetical protein
MLKCVKPLIRDLVISSAAGCLVASGTLAGQTRDELRRKYGDPLTETFIVRPDISVTATYARNGRITELLISPRITGSIKSRAVTLRQDSVKAVIDQLVPRSVRGKRRMAEFVNMTCLPEDDCAGSLETYEKVTIYYNAAAQGVHYAVIQWKE